MMNFTITFFITAAELDLPSETGSIGRRKPLILSRTWIHAGVHDYTLYDIPGPSIVGGVHWTANESVDSGSESDDDIGSIPPPPLDDSSR